MITLFRRIRQKLIEPGSVTKYLLYAVGEILLVVIGILIALQVNNWNEERISQNREYDFLVEIRDNLIADALQIDEILVFNQAKRDTLSSTIQTLVGDAGPVETTWFIQNRMSVLVEFQIFFPNRVGFDNMINAESIALVRDTELREALSAHYSAEIIYLGTQERTGELTRNFTDRIGPYISRKELVDSRWSSESQLPSASASDIKKNPRIMADLNAMNSINQAQSLILTDVKGQAGLLIEQIEAYLDQLN